ncbi:TAT-variant-translocated molybdopterin oxidoreductase [Urechidicola croceus]|uniref:Quinol:cytochrome C oxidoreductase n=1 Tax=Urechidicola croceus TaxID=1850246 RepID=A0A1D8PA87_9FLAO|nr:TAT-variant-translocated molybdopterin oxidoreductase [Urechidicola croceus]AOW21487.1 quinol:cytochrome C oxidoreductase [Urechidicola croceus]
MASNKKYWKSVEELNENSSIVDTLRQNEFVEEIPTDEFLGDKKSLEESSTTRRDFLKYVGFTTAAASLVACEGPVKKAIPYLVKPDEIIPGVADYYATAIADGFDFANVLVKVREGRPIKIEPNKEANGSTNARVQASVLSLYDGLRLRSPRINGDSVSENISWSDVDVQIVKQLTDVSASGKAIAFLTGTDASPSTTSLISQFAERYGNVRHVIYDSVSESAAIDAYEAMYGSRALPSYDFSKAKTIVSVGADFLGDWQGGNFEAGYAKGRIPDHGKMSHHIQFESNMTLSGANADTRVMVKPSAQKTILADLYNVIVNGGSAKNADVAVAVKQIRNAGKNAVIVTGIQDKNAQLLALAINNAIGSLVLDVNTTNNTRQGNDADVAQLISDMKSGKIGALIINNSNPIYTLPNSAEFIDALGKVDLSVAFSMTDNETANAVQYALPTPHYLESWGVVEMKKGHFSFVQPTIQPLFDTRQFHDALLKWNGSTQKYYEYLKSSFAGLGADKSFSQSLQDGSFSIPIIEKEVSIVNDVDFASAYRTISSVKESGLELQLYTKTGLGDGQQANNPWLQELPDPITRATWDNYLTVSQSDAETLGIKNWNVANGGLNGSYVQVSLGDEKLVVPAIIQPGQAPGSVGLALGYGRKAGMKEEMKIGKNAYAFYKNFNSTQSGVSVDLVSGEHEFACTQLHNTLMGRGDIIKETTLSTYNDHSLDPKHTWNPVPVVSLKHQEVEATTVDLWDEFDRSVGHHFNLSIDLNACTGCGACVIACHTENNVPVVGKDEVRKSRDMHWLRIDRYYSHEENFEGDNTKKEEMNGLLGEKGTLSGYGEMEKPSSNPEVAFQPIMCQHCNHAPCETVCPVAATSHGRQGQNHMAYNRCVGTRYCANNCPYKVRRFNWFDYANNNEFDFHMNDDLGKMVLNPDVTVRSRGVMEKCSMCIQMTQATILKAKKEGRPVKDEEFQTACSNACSTGAMVFGDINDKDSEVAKLKEDTRAYHLLEHVGTKPNVVYQVKVRNTEV